MGPRGIPLKLYQTVRHAWRTQLAPDPNRGIDHFPNQEGCLGEGSDLSRRKTHHLI